MQKRELLLRFAGLWVGLLCLGRQTTAQSVQGAAFDPTPVPLERSEGSEARTVTPMDLLTLRDPKGLSISPDGKYIAFVLGQAVYETNAYRSGLFVVETGGKHSVRTLGTAGMPHWDGINQWIAEPPQWSADGSKIWYRARMRAGQRWEVWCWDLRSGEKRQLTHVLGDVETFRYVPNKQELLLTVVNRQVNSAEQKNAQSGIRFTGQIRPYQSIPIVTQLELSEEPVPTYWAYDLRTGRTSKARSDELRDLIPTRTANTDSDQAELANYHLVDSKRALDADTVAYIYEVSDPSVSRTRARRLLLWSKQKRAVTEVTPQAYFVDQTWWTADGSALYFTQRDGLGRSPELWRVSRDGSGLHIVFKAMSGEYVSSFSPDKTGSHFACLWEKNISPPRIAVLDTAAGSVRVLVDPNPGFEDLRRSPAERVEGVNRYGDKWFGYLVKPLDHKPGERYPLIVTTYRSGEYFLRGASGDENPIQVYAANGFAVLSFDVGPIRNLPSGNFEEKLQDWSSPTASLEDAIHQLSSRGLVDPNRVGIAGFSHGEEIAGFAVSHTDLFHAAVGAAFYDPCFYFLGGSDWWTVFKEWGLGGWPEGEAKTNWRNVAMWMNAERIHTPILENASDTEYLIYLPVYRSLGDLGIPIELYIYPNELHVRNQPRHRFEIYERNLAWFSQWLKGAGVPRE